MHNLTERQSRQQALLDEYESLDATIRAYKEQLASLETRRMMTQRFLEVITRPAQIKSPDPKLGYVYRGESFHASSCINLYTTLVCRILDDFPKEQERIAHEIASSGHTRRYIARSGLELFAAKSEDWIHQHSIRLPSGWYLDTNLNRQTMATLSKKFIRAAGLQPGRDIQLYWGI